MIQSDKVKHFFVSLILTCVFGAAIRTMSPDLMLAMVLGPLLALLVGAGRELIQVNKKTNTTSESMEDMYANIFGVAAALPLLHGFLAST